VAPALATDVVFSGNIANTCTLAVATTGLLALSLDGKTIGSDQPGGISASLTIVSLGANTVTLAAPTRTSSPGAYVAAGEQIKVAYAGTGGLNLVNQAYTALGTNFSTGLLPLTALTINNEIVNTNGFAQGHYETTTVVTCS